MSGSHAAELVFEDGSLEDVYRCVKPETGDVDGRGSVDVEFDGDHLVFEVRAPDLVSLRAGVNTWLRLVDLAEEAVEAR